MEMINQQQYWSFSIPHESSGPCYTYDPPFDTDPGYTDGMVLTLNSTDWDADLEIFLHTKGKFFYNHDSTFNTAKVSLSKLKGVNTGHPKISGRPNNKGHKT